MNSTLARRFLYALLLCSLALSLLFALRVPLGDNPDETAHKDYIQLLLENHGFVKFIPHDELPAGALSRDEAHQPPLYYFLCVPVFAATGGNTLALRLVATLLQLGTIMLVYKACRDFFRERPEIAVGAAAFVAFLPTQAQLGASINNDPLITLICIAIFYQLGLLIQRGQDARGAAILGVLFGLGLWTKLSVIQLVPPMLVAYLLAVRGGRFTVRHAAGLFIGAMVVGVVLASPWLIRNTILYRDPLTLQIYQKTGPNFTPQMIQEAAGWSSTDYLRNMAVRSFGTFWYFLHPNLPLKPLGVWVGPVLPLVTVLLLALSSLLALYKKWKSEQFTESEGRIVSLFILAVPLLIPFFARFIMTVFQAQGRYFLPALLPVAVLMTLAFARPATPPKVAFPITSLIAVLVVPVILLIIAIYQLLGNGFVLSPG